MLQGLRTGEKGALWCLPFHMLFVGITVRPCLLSGIVGVRLEEITLLSWSVVQRRLGNGAVGAQEARGPRL